MARHSKKITDDSGGISLGGEKNFSVSIGEMIGRGKPAREDKICAAGKNRASEKETMINGARPQAVKEAILRRESAGRGGRTVTVVEPRPPLAAEAAENLAKAMRKGLGCGSHTEGAKIILQGDMRDRAEAWLTKQGAEKIIRGN